MNKPVKRGFTLAELLLCMLILGVISTFSIPKILHAQQNVKKKAVLRETIAALSEIIYLGSLTRAYSPGSVDSVPNYIFSKINPIKICNNSMTEGCFTQGFSAYPTEADNKGLILASGAAITGLNDGWEPDPGEWQDGIVVDWNGAAPPNVEGDDQIWLHVCYGPNPCSNGLRRVGLVSAVDAISETMIQEIFSR